MSYITKTNLSLGPQFGSQMSQYAGLLALSKHLDSDICFFQEYLKAFRGVKLFDAFDLPLAVRNSSQKDYDTYVLKDVICDEQVFNVDPNKNWDIQGWFHLYHYWDKYEDLIKDTFNFKKEILDQATKNIGQIKEGEEYPIISVHFRRGDYLQVASLNLTLDYYNEAISIFLEKFTYFKLLVFSDDIEWCKEVLEGDNVYFSEGNSNYVDMCMMTLCDHNIVANSSFSWWGAYLNTNKGRVVICPEDYIGPSDKESQFINKNYYPKDWIALKLNYTE
jgi:hypothetical protein